MVDNRSVNSAAVKTFTVQRVQIRPTYVAGELMAAWFTQSLNLAANMIE